LASREPDSLKICTALESRLKISKAAKMMAGNVWLFVPDIKATSIDLPFVASVGSAPHSRERRHLDPAGELVQYGERERPEPP
jgi:hypothetical protein